MSARRRPRRRTPERRDRRPARGAARRPRGLRLILMLAALAAVGWELWTFAGPGPAARQGGSTTVILPRGSGVVQIARQLSDAGVIRSQSLFITAAKLAPRTLKAGEYEFAGRASMARVLSAIRNGQVVRHWVTIPEGWTSDMAAEAIDRSPVLTGAAAAAPEGSILPETYEVQRGEDRAQVIGRMREAQEKLLADLWKARQPGLPFATPTEAVTLASIVEKETAIAGERPRIAAVYINRLRAGMRLESDPTIIYGVSKGRALGRGISRDELNAATPYNTYRVAGLPPTPIANPGRAAIAAVLDPPHTDELYFVANGEGGHAFAATYAEHQKNVARWRAIERARTAAGGAG